MFNISYKYAQRGEKMRIKAKVKIKFNILLIIALLFIIVLPITSVKSIKTIEETLQERREELNSKIEETVVEIGDVQGNISEAFLLIQEINERIAKYQVEVNELNTQVMQLESAITKSTNDLKVSQENYDKQMKILEKRIVAIYEAGETVYLDVLLNSKSLEEFLSSYYYLSEISRYDKALVDIVLKNKEKLELKNTSLLKHKEELKAIVINKERATIILKNTEAVRASYLKQLNTTEKELQEKLEQYENEMYRLEQDILDVTLLSMEEEYTGGELAWPVPGHKTITSPYGMRIHPIFNVLRMHTGADVGAPTGVPVIAVNDGVVTLARYSASYGNYVMVDHGGGIVTLYAHASEICVAVGDVVKAGDVIIRVGSTGWSTGPHLHFEIRINGNTVNPLPYVLKEYKEKEDEKEKEEKTENDKTEKSE